MIIRLMRFRVLTWAVLLATSLPVCASLSVSQLSAYDTQIFSDPRAAYLELQAQTIEASAPTSRLIWLALRKAQVEDVLGLYDDMAATLDGLDIQKEKMDDKQQAYYLYLSGVRAHKRGELKAAVALLEQAVKVASRDSSLSIYALSVRELGYAHALSGDYYEANLILHEGYRDVVAHNQPFFNALMEESLGDTYNYSGNYEDSEAYYEDALNHFQALGYKPFVASTLLGLATVNRRLKNWQRALTLFELYGDALTFSEGYGSQYYLHYGRAMTLAEMGNCAAAIPAIDEVLMLQGLRDYDAELLKKRALCYLEQGDIPAAKADWEAARDIFDNMADLQGTQWQLELNYVAGRIAWQEEKFEQALSQLDDYFRATVGLQQRNNSERLRRIQARLETERKDQEIALLLQRAQLKESQIREQVLRVEQQQLYLAGVFVVTAFLLAFIVFQYRHAKKLLSLSIRDDLTGLHNRRYIFDYFRYESRRGLTEHNAFSLVAFDIDNFKEINDSFGHVAGDRVIKEVAKVAHDTLRANDVISRIGGDEFLIVLSRTSREESEDIASRILSNIADHAFPINPSNTIKVTVSMGIAYPDPADAEPVDIDKLIEAADRALYRSKRAGKNQLTEAEPYQAAGVDINGCHTPV